MAHDQKSSTRKAFDASPPDLDPVPAICILIDKSPPSTLRECLKLMCQRTVEDAKAVAVMLEEAKYCEDLSEEEEDYTIEYQPYRCEDPVADIMFKALLSRTVELDQTHRAQRKAERKERKKQMAEEREHTRAVQRKKDQTDEMNHDYESLLEEASEMVKQIQRFKDKGKPSKYGEAIKQSTSTMMMKSSAAGQLHNQIAALNAIPVKLEDCRHCGDRFDVNRSEPESCRRHFAGWPTLKILAKDIADSCIGALKLDQKSDLWPSNWDVNRDDIAGLMWNLTKDIKEHQASLPFFKWTCCGRPGNSQGCNVGKHQTSQQKRVD